MQQQISGVGVGLRALHYDFILSERPKIGWFEALADNYLQPNSAALEILLDIREHYPITLHSVGMSLGSTEPLNREYFHRYKQLIERVDPVLVSDHLCWISNQQEVLHELLPLPYNEVTLNHVVGRIEQVQEWLCCPIAVENISSYLQFAHSSMSEAEFVSEVAKRSGAKILFDVNNLYVNAVNHDTDVSAFIQSVEPELVAYYHLAGFEDCGTHLLDTHGAPIYPDVWELYERVIQSVGAKPTLVEWDNNLPSFEWLEQEAQKAQDIMEAAHG